MSKQDLVKLAKRVLTFNVETSCANWRQEALWQVTEIHSLAHAYLEAHAEIEQSRDRIDALNRRLDWLEAAHLNLAKEHDAAIKDRNDAYAETGRLRAALAGVAPACRAFLGSVPARIRADAARSLGVYMWRRDTNVPDLAVGIGVPECKAVIAAMDGAQGKKDKR